MEIKQSDPASEQEAKGSRDKLRTYLKQMQELAFAAAGEVEKLKNGAIKDSPFRLSYRYCDAYLLQIMSSIELARVVMRKRKKHDAMTTVDAPKGATPEKIGGDI